MISYQVEAQIARIGLANAPANAINERMLSLLIEAMDRAARDDQVRAVVLCSEVSQRFCSGLDLRLLHGAQPSEARRLLERLYSELYEAQCRLGKPSIAAIEGAARGGGMTVAISCDVIVSGDAASFGYPEIDIGVLPAIHFSHLPGIVGKHRAFELLFSGRSFDAHEARTLGLLSRVVPAGQALAEATALAQVFAAKPQATVRLGRAAFIEAVGGAARRAQIRQAIDTFCEVVDTDEAREGIQSFAERRKPSWLA